MRDSETGYTVKEMAANIAMQIIQTADSGQKPTMSAFDFSFAMAVMTGFPKEICLDMIMDEQARIRKVMAEVKAEVN